MSFPKYAKYQDSGVTWLGEIPAHWGVLRSRRMFGVRNEAALDSDRQVTASQKWGVIYQSEFVEREGRRVVETIKGTDTLRRVYPGDFVISLRSFQGGIEWCRIEGSVTFHYVVLRQLKHVHEPFFAHLFKSSRYIDALRSTTNLIRDGQDLRFSHFIQVDLPLVPEEEQREIAAFLDRETSKIDALVAEQRRLIELLKEKRQAVISHAVTKGLNPDVRMKPSGVEWFGDVPSNWNVSKCRHFIHVLTGFAFPSAQFSTDENDWRLLRGVNVGVGLIRWDDVAYWKRLPGDNLDDFEMSAGDLVIGMDRPLIADGIRLARLNESDLPCLLLQRVASLKAGPSVDVDYLAALISSRMFVAHFLPETTGVSVPHISPDQILNFEIPVPPIAEQRLIAAFIRKETSRIDDLAQQIEMAIELLQERRTTLISAAVTGKIDVRHLAATEAA
ncbi:MAG: restriction endonuclease subunit S [Pirellulales bacterium]|nr:restriction endonuclease subunit S [Pirellulales bacterium]